MPEFFGHVAWPLAAGLLLTALVDAAFSTVSARDVLRRPVRGWLVHASLLTLGLAAGFVRLDEKGGGFDALMAVTVLTWLVYGGFLVVRPAGRRGAYVLVAGFALVILVRIALAGSHF